MSQLCGGFPVDPGSVIDPNLMTRHFQQKKSLKKRLKSVWLRLGILGDPALLGSAGSTSLACRPQFSNDQRDVWCLCQGLRVQTALTFHIRPFWSWWPLISGLLPHAPRSCQYLIAEDLEGSSVHQLVGISLEFCSQVFHSRFPSSRLSFRHFPSGQISFG